MTNPFRRDAQVVALLVGLILTGGCDSTPEAPELVDSPVYQNDQEGFRFRVPEGWTQTASSNLPPGDFEGENFLVRYLVQSPEGGATLQVLCFVDSGQADMEQHHAKGAFGVAKWKLVAPANPVDLTGQAAQRIRYEGRLGGKTMNKEVLCVSRGNRMYSFVGMFVEGDDKAQHAIRRATDSLIWEQ